MAKGKQHPDTTAKHVKSGIVLRMIDFDLLSEQHMDDFIPSKERPTHVLFKSYDPNFKTDIHDFLAGIETLPPEPSPSDQFAE